MTDQQEEKLGMAVKVNDFLVAKAANLSAITQIATEQGTLNGLINDITDVEGEVTADYTGDAQNKNERRQVLENIVRHVGWATAAYYQSIGEPNKVKLADYTRTELTNSRDTALFAKSKHIFRLADPVSASLAGFNSSAVEVADLQTKSDAFFEVIQKPAESKDYRKTFVQAQVKLFVRLDETLEKLDVYMATFEMSDELLFMEYTNRRMQDNTGAHPSTKLDVSLNIPANTTLNIDTNAFTMEDDDVIVLINAASSVVLSVGFGADASSIASPANVNAGDTFLETASQAGFNGSNTYLNVRNATGAAGSFRIKVRD